MLKHFGLLKSSSNYLSGKTTSSLLGHLGVDMQTDEFARQTLKTNVLYEFAALWSRTWTLSCDSSQMTLNQTTVGNRFMAENRNCLRCFKTSYISVLGGTHQ